MAKFDNGDLNGRAILVAIALFVGVIVVFDVAKDGRVGEVEAAAIEQRETAGERE